jgi:adenylate cyclase
MRIMGLGPSRLSPQLCVQCHLYASQYLGGAEAELTMLFADLRGSTALAEKMIPAEFGKLISRFFAVASDVIINSQALLDRLVGDQVIGFYLPGFAGQEHKHLAIQASQELLRAIGHGPAAGPWIPLGVGIHTGVAFVGSVGDVANTAPRLSSSAAIGEIFISENAMVTELNLGQLETRSLELKGKGPRVNVYVLRDFSP